MSVCKDCGRRTPEFYMLVHELWHDLVPEESDNIWSPGDNYNIHLCFSCVEQRLGRNLAFEDFLFTPLEMYVRQCSPDRLLEDDVWGVAFGEDETDHLRFYSMARISKTLRELQQQILDKAGVKQTLRYSRRQASDADQPLPDYEV